MKPIPHKMIKLHDRGLVGLDTEVYIGPTIRMVDGTLVCFMVVGRAQMGLGLPLTRESRSEDQDLSTEPDLGWKLTQKSHFHHVHHFLQELVILLFLRGEVGVSQPVWATKSVYSV
jgi:hypothetical protein